jgi:hypothetical protein
MNLSDVQEFILRNRRKFIFGLVAVVLISLFLGFIFQEINPEVAEEDKLPPFVLAEEPGQVIGQADLSNLASVDFPSSAPIYKVEKLDLTFTQADAVGWAKSFGFSASFGEVVTPLGKIYVFFKTGEELTVTSNPRSLHYTRESKVGTGTILENSAAIRKAKEFLAARKLPDPSSFSPTVRYLSTIGERTSETNVARANFVEVNFAWSVGGLDLLGESSSDTAIRMIFDRSDRVVYLSYQFLDYSFSLDKEIPLLNFSQASGALRREAQIVLVRPVDDVDNWALSESYSLGSFAPESVKLIYVMQPRAEFLYPIYLFEGPGRIGEIDVNAAAYILAVQSQYVREE